jgi:hypothetical protein
MNEYVKKSLIVLTIFGTGAAIGRFSLPAKIVEKEHIVYQDKVVEKVIDTKDIKKKNNKTYTRTEKVLPDGTKTTETKIVDNNLVDQVDKKTTNETQDISQIIDKEKTTTYSQQSTLISVMASPNFTLDAPGINFGLSVQQRVLGPVYIGGFGFENKSYGMSLGLAF